MSDDPEEERFARQDSGPYSGWSSAFIIVVTLIVNEGFTPHRLCFGSKGDMRKCSFNTGHIESGGIG
jgi:hypothetical protein